MKPIEEWTIEDWIEDTLHRDENVDEILFVSDLRDYLSDKAVVPIEPSDEMIWNIGMDDHKVNTSPLSARRARYIYSRIVEASTPSTEKEGE